LHRFGLRFRVDFPIRDPDGHLVRPDIVFTRARIAVFVDGCFWHGCPEHGRRPTIQNGSYWGPKIVANTRRDAKHTDSLRAAGWTVLRFWEHDAPEQAAFAILKAYREAVTPPGS
jgi:DNA mismatch endonuclease (patch repair protein)